MGKVKIDTRIEMNDCDRVHAIAIELYEGNFSMALRKIILAGLDNIENNLESGNKNNTDTQ